MLISVRNIGVGLLFVLILQSCDTKASKPHLSQSNGAILTGSFVAPKQLLNKPLKEKIISIFSQEFIGLPTPEPIFFFSTLPLETFEGFTQNSRNILMTDIGIKDTITYRHNVYAKPQLMIKITGESEGSIIRQLTQYSSQIIDSLYTQERIENIKRIKSSVNTEKLIAEKLGVQLDIPSPFFFGKSRTKNLFWGARNIKKGIANLVIYDLPYDLLGKLITQEELNQEVLKIRDSIGKHYIPGPSEGKYYTTAKIIPTYTKRIEVNGLKMLETRGLWEIVNYAMGGPAINYMIQSPNHKRTIVIEGFVYSPRESKRHYIFEMENIVRTIIFK